MTEEEIRERYPTLIPDHAIIEVRAEWLPLVDEYLSQVGVIYGDTEPSIALYTAYESDGLVIDCDDLSWRGNQDPTLKRQVRDLALAVRERSRNV